MAVVIKRTLGAGLVALAVAATSPALLAAANPGEFGVNFKGQVVDNTCALVRLNAISGKKIVQFGKISQRDFVGVGSVSNNIQYEHSILLVFENCGPDTSSVQISFSGPTNNTLGAVDNRMNAEGETTYATNVGIQVWDTRGSVPIQLKSDDPTATTTVDLNNTETIVGLETRVVQTGDSQPSTGKLDTSGTLYFSYN